MKRFSIVICFSLLLANNVKAQPPEGNFDDTLNWVGNTHNECLDSILTSILADQVSLYDTTALKLYIKTKTCGFFYRRGIDTAHYPTNVSFGPGTDTIQFNPGDYSVLGYDILLKVRNLMLQYDPEDDDDYFLDLDSLKTNSVPNITDPLERYNVGLPIAIAISSTQYWKDKGEDWNDLFMELYSFNYLKNANTIEKGGPNSSNNQNTVKFPFGCPIKWRAVGAADVIGGIRGAVLGTPLGGPIGGVGGAVVSGSVSSAVGLASQFAACLFSWF